MEGRVEVSGQGGRTSSHKRGCLWVRGVPDTPPTPFWNAPAPVQPASVHHGRARVSDWRGWPDHGRGSDQ